MMMQRRNPDWYDLQKKVQGWDEIAPDQKIIDLVADKGWSLDVSRCHDNLKTKLRQFHVDKPHTDFSVITDLELSKLPLPFVIKMIKHYYEKSNIGVYVAMLSYYINSPERFDLADNYPNNLARVFEMKFNFANSIEDHSCVSDLPINHTHGGALLEGSNFIFVHPNIRYFLWK